MPFLCVPGWDIYVFSHESSETIKNIWFQSVCSVGWLFWAKNPFFLFLILIGPNHSEMVPNGKKTVRHHFWTIWDHFWVIWTNLDQKWKKWVFHQKWPTHRAKVIFWLISAIPERPRQPGPIFLVQNGVYICPRHRSICFMLNLHL